MVSCGIHPNDDQIKLYNELKVEKVHRFLVFGLNKEVNSLETFGIGKKQEGLKDLISLLPNDDCRYVVYDFEYETFENPPRATQKLLLFAWCPDKASIKVKVPFTSIKSELMSSFTGIAKALQVSDSSQLDFEELRKEFN